MEVWKDIKGYEGRYQISNCGRVKSLNYHKENREAILVPKVTKTGYLIIGLWCDKKKKFFPIHRLVAKAFIAPFDGEQVNHIDADKANNHVENLEWCTARENTLHAIKLGLFDDSAKKLAKANVERSKAVEVTNLQTGEILKFASTREAARMLNINRWRLINHLRGIGCRVKNYTACYC